MHGKNSERKLRMQTLQDARSVDDYTSQASYSERGGLLPQIGNVNRATDGKS